MDDLDRRLVALLRENARAPTAALAKQLKVSRGTVQNRLDRLQAAGTLLGYTIRLGDEDHAGRVRAVSTIQIEGGRMAGVVAALRAIPALKAVHSTNGRWDLVAELDAPDLAAFSAALDAIRAVAGVGCDGIEPASDDDAVLSFRIRRADRPGWCRARVGVHRRLAADRDRRRSSIRRVETRRPVGPVVGSMRLQPETPRRHFG